MQRLSKYPSYEYALLADLGRILGKAGAPGMPWELTLGDDAAIRRCGKGERLVVTADIAVENVHFTRATATFEEIGFRTMAANVSDCAAMAALPEAAFVQLVFPRGGKATAENTRALYRGFAAACRTWGFRLRRRRPVGRPVLDNRHHAHRPGPASRQTAHAHRRQDRRRALADRLSRPQRRRVRRAQ